MREMDEKWALFWCNLLHPVIFDEVDPKDANRFLKELAQKEALFPNGKTKRPSLSTLRRKLNLYRQDGFEALARKPRNDRGKPRCCTPDVIAAAVEAKKASCS